MTEALRSTGAPLVYMVAAVVLFLGIKAIPRLRLVGRGAVLVGAALPLAGLGTVLESGTAALGTVAGAFAGGAVLGGLLAGGVTAKKSAARLAWIPAASGAALVILGASLWRAVDISWVARTAGGAAASLGLAGAVLGLTLAARGQASSRGMVLATMVVALVGWSAMLLGFAVQNLMLLVAGGVLGTGGLAFGRVVSRSAGRTLGALLFQGETPDPYGYTNVRTCDTEEAGAVLEAARRVVVVPGYGMAAAGAQHATKEVADLLDKRGVTVSYAIHPAAGVVPGHMNIALDEANVPHERLAVGDAATRAIGEADAVLVVGANDVVNAEAAADPASPLHGMAALDLAGVRSVFAIKRSLRPGAGGVKNPLFERPNTMMLLGHPKRVMQALLAELKGGASH